MPISVLANIAALEALATASSVSDIVFVEGYVTAADGGEGFFYNSGVTGVTPNGGTIIEDAVSRIWLRETEGLNYSVRWFGAAGDGSADDTDAIQRTINAVAAILQDGFEVPGGTVYFPSLPQGNYLVSSGPINVAATQIRLRGDGSGSLIINGTSGQPAVSFGRSGSTVYSRCGLEKLAFSAASGTTDTTGINIVNSSFFNFSDLLVFNYPNALKEGIVLNGAAEIFFESVRVQNCSDNGIKILNNSLDVFVVNSKSDANNGTGWYIQDSQGLYFSNCSAYGNNGHGWFLDSGGNGNVNFFFVNCIGDTSGAENWVIASLHTGLFSNCWGSNQQSLTGVPYASGFHIYGPPSSGDVVGTDNLIFVGGAALANNYHGVFIDDVGGLPTNIQFIGFTFGNATVEGQGNGKGASGGYGIAIGSGSPPAAHIRVLGGSAQGNSSGPVSVSGSATDVAIEGLVTGSSATSTVSVGASPFTYTNSLGISISVTVGGGTVSQIDLVRAGISTTTNLSSGVFQLRPNDGLTIVYSSAPKITVTAI
jgi:hypothetical protein